MVGLKKKQRRMMRYVYQSRQIVCRLCLQIRFTVPEIRTLLTYFELENVRWRRRNWPDPEMVFCFVLCKLSYPHRLFEFADYFGYSPSYLSYVANDLIEYLVERYNSLLEWHPSLTYERMKEYAKACKELGELQGKSTIWGFVDGIFRQFCRPKNRQQLVYSKYRRSHGMEWFVGIVPDGLIGFLYGPFEGKVNDIRMLKKSGLQRRLRHLFSIQGRRPLYLFGDKAYKSQRFIMAPCVGIRSGWRKKFNKKNGRFTNWM